MKSPQAARDPRPCEGEPGPARPRDACGRIPRAAHGVSDHRTARHADVHRTAVAPLRCKLPHARRAAGRHAIWCGAQRHRSGRRSGATANRATRSSRSRRRSRCRPGSAAAAPMLPRPSSDWRGCGAARRSRCSATSASGIGADVAFFLSGGTALGLGRGEEIYPLVDLPPHWIVDRAAAVWRVDGGSVLLVRRRSRRPD